MTIFSTFQFIMLIGSMHCSILVPLGTSFEITATQNIAFFKLRSSAYAWWSHYYRSQQNNSRTQFNANFSFADSHVIGILFALFSLLISNYKLATQTALKFENICWSMFFFSRQRSICRTSKHNYTSLAAVNFARVMTRFNRTGETVNLWYWDYTFFSSFLVEMGHVNLEESHL